MVENFYTYQRRCFRFLLGWGAGSVCVGALLALRRDPFWRQCGLQTLLWGAIDAAIAYAGLRGTATKALTPPDAATTRRDSRTYWLLLLINGALDVTYVAGGVWLARRPRRDRQGMGAGIIVQGALLLLYDNLLAWDVWRRWLKD